MVDNERETPSWSDFGDAVTALQKAVSNSDFEPDCIVAIARGGLILGGAMAHKLGIKDIYTLNVEYYKGSGLDDVRMDEPVIVGPDFDLAYIEGRNVLVVDDVAESGVTLRFIESMLEGAGDFRTAVWFTKPDSEVTPDFAAANTAKWIVFPWSPFSPFGEAEPASL